MEEPKMTEFDQLPYLAMRKIFEYLELLHLVKCRAVSRRFKFYADQAAAKLDRLVVILNAKKCAVLFRRYIKTWYQTDRRINFENSISPSALASVRSSPFKLDEQLKFLYVHLELLLIIEFDLNTDFDIAILNSFKQLVHLEIKLWPTEGKQNLLTLPNLKVLDVSYYLNVPYVLRTPQLQVLSCSDITAIRVWHPETIEHLECECESTAVNRLTKFKNLKSLKLSLSGREADQFSIVLSNWNDLKELHLNVSHRFADAYQYEDFKDWLLDIMSQRSDPKRKDLKLYFSDVLLLEVNQLLDYPIMASEESEDDEYDEERGMTQRQARRAEHHFQFKNYRLLCRDSYPDVKEVDFNMLLKLDIELSADFFRRFPQIEELTAAGPSAHRDDLEWFLKNATALRRLSLSDISLDQSFMERLLIINRRLTHLEVNKLPVSNFDFILQFEELEAFRTDRELCSLELATKAFQQLKNLSIFRFRVDYESVQIQIIDEQYELRFFRFKNNREIFCRDSLSWPELETLFEQRCPAGPEKRMKIKRARLE